MRMDMSDITYDPGLFEHGLDSACMKSVIWSSYAHEQCRIGVFPRCKILLKVKLGPRIKVYDSFLITLAEDYALSFLEINVIDIKSFKLSDAHPR